MKAVLAIIYAVIGVITAAIGNSGCKSMGHKLRYKGLVLTIAAIIWPVIWITTIVKDIQRRLENRKAHEVKFEN